MTKTRVVQVVGAWRWEGPPLSSNHRCARGRQPAGLGTNQAESVQRAAEGHPLGLVRQASVCGGGAFCVCPEGCKVAGSRELLLLYSAGVVFVTNQLPSNREMACCYPLGWEPKLRWLVDVVCDLMGGMRDATG